MSGSAVLFRDPDVLSAAELIDELVALERQVASVQARQCRVLAAMTEHARASVTAELDKHWLHEDVRTALAESAIGAGSRVLVAETLVHRLPATLEALSHGLVSYRQARLLCEQVQSLDDAVTALVETEVLAALHDPAADRTLAAFSRRLRRAVLAADPTGAEKRQDCAVEDRRVGCTPAPDGVSTLWGILPAQGAVLLDAALTFLAEHAAKADPADPRTHVQRRADALVQLAKDTLNGGCSHCIRRSGAGNAHTGNAHTGNAHTWDAHTATPRGAAKPAVNVTVALSTLLGLDDTPGQLDGYGPVSSALARRIAADPAGTWRRLVTDEFGHLLDYGRSIYRPPADLDRHVRAHDRECVFPTCHRRSASCELDHTLAWDDGGHTNADNLKPCCPRHHHAKHDTDWDLQRLPDGILQWTSPTGHIYRTDPTTYPLDRTLELIKEHDDARTGDHPPRAESDHDPPPDPPPY